MNAKIIEYKYETKLNKLAIYVELMVNKKFIHL